MFQIYPVDVAKTVYQKKLLAAGPHQAARPDIEFFKSTSYRGMSDSVILSKVHCTIANARGL